MYDSSWRDDLYADMQYDESLMHYGIPGMKWGHRKSSYSSGGSGKKRSGSSRSKKLKRAAAIAGAAALAGGAAYMYSKSKKGSGGPMKALPGSVGDSGPRALGSGSRGALPAGSSKTNRSSRNGSVSAKTNRSSRNSGGSARNTRQKPAGYLPGNYQTTRYAHDKAVDNNRVAYENWKTAANNGYGEKEVTRRKDRLKRSVNKGKSSYVRTHRNRNSTT